MRIDFYTQKFICFTVLKNNYYEKKRCPTLSQEEKGI